MKGKREFRVSLGSLAATEEGEEEESASSSLSSFGLAWKSTLRKFKEREALKRGMGELTGWNCVLKWPGSF